MGIAQSYQSGLPTFPQGINYNIEQTVNYILQNNTIQDEYIKLNLNGDLYEARKSDLKDKMIFNSCSNVKNLLPVLRLNNPILSNSIQANIPEKILYTFLQSEEGRIFKRSSDFLSLSPHLQKTTSSTTYFQPSTSSQQLTRCNSNYIGISNSNQENNSQVQQNILNEITNSQNGSGKSLTRNNSLSNAKSVASIPVSILKNKGQVHNHPVISTSSMIKITPIGTSSQNGNNSSNNINTSNRSVTPTRAPQPTLLSDTLYTPSNTGTISKAPYINLNGQNENNQPQTPIGKSMFDFPQDSSSQYQVPKTPTATQSGIINSIIGSNNILNQNNRFTMTPLNTINSSNIAPPSAIKPVLISQTMQNNNTSGQQSIILSNNPERIRSMTPLPYSNTQSQFGSSMFSNNNVPQQPTTPNGRIQNGFEQSDINNPSTPNSNALKSNIYNFPTINTYNGVLLSQPYSTAQAIQNNTYARSSSSSNVLGLINMSTTPLQNNTGLTPTNQYSTYNLTSNLSNLSGTQTLPHNLSSTGGNIKIGQLLSQRAVTPPPAKTTPTTQILTQVALTNQNSKPILETIPLNEVQENVGQNTAKPSTPCNQSSTFLSNGNLLLHSNNQNNSQAHFSSLIVQNNPSYSSLALGSILQSNSINNVNSNYNIGSALPTLNTPTANIQQPTNFTAATTVVPYESVRNKFQQLRKMTGVRKASEMSHSPINNDQEEQNTINSNTQQTNNFSQLGNSQNKLSAQKSRSISNLNYNNTANENYNIPVRKLSEIPSQYTNQLTVLQDQNNFSKNILGSSGKKGLTKTLSCNNITAIQQIPTNLQQTQKEQKGQATTIPYYLGRTSSYSNIPKKDISNLPSLSNISQILYTQDDQSKSMFNIGGIPSTKVQNAFLPGLSPIHKTNQGADNSRSFACEALPLVGNNNIYANQITVQSDNEKLSCTPKTFHFNQPNTLGAPLNDAIIQQKQVQDIKDKAKEEVNQIIQRTVAREFQNLKQLTDLATQHKIVENQRKYQEFLYEDDQKQLLQSMKNNEMLSQTLNEIQNTMRQNTVESLSNNNRYTQSSQEPMNTLPSRSPATGFKNVIINSVQSQQSINNIFSQNIKEVVSTVIRPPAYNNNLLSTRSNRFNNSQQDEDDNGIKKTCSINFGYNNQYINESIVDNKNIQGRNSQDSNESPCSSSLKISEINKPNGQDQNSFGIKIFQAGGSIASTFHDLNSFAYKNIESQRQNAPYFNQSIQDNQIFSARQNTNSSTNNNISNPQLNTPGGLSLGVHSNQLQSTQPTYCDNYTPKNQIESYQLNTLSYSGTNADITLKKLQNNNSQSIQVEQPQKSYNSQQPHLSSFNQEIEKIQSSQSNFPIQKVQFNKNSISGMKNATPNSKRSSIYSHGGDSQIQQLQQQQQIEEQITPKNQQQNRNHNQKQSNSFKELFENEIGTGNQQQLSQYQGGVEDSQMMQQRSRNYSGANLFQNDIYQSKSNTLNPSEKQRNISIMSEYSMNNSTPQKLINTATKQRMMDEIEHQRLNGGQGVVQIVSQQDIDSIRNNVTHYWNSYCNDIIAQNKDSKGNSLFNQALHPQQQQLQYIQTPSSQNIQIDPYTAEPIHTISTPQNKNYETAPSPYQIQKQPFVSSSQNNFNVSVPTASKDFEIRTNLHLLQTPETANQFQSQSIQQTKNSLQSSETNIAFQKPPLQNSALMRSQKQSIQKQSISKQRSIQYSEQSPSNQVDIYQSKQQHYFPSNNSSISQIGSNQNRLSPQMEQQLIANSQEYKMNLKNSQPQYNTPGQSYQSMKQMQQQIISSLNPQQLKSYQNSIENYSYAIKGQQLFSQQTPQQNSVSRQPQDQQYDQISEEEEVDAYRTLEQRDLMDNQQEEEIDIYNQQNYHNQNDQQYMTQEQMMRLEQQQNLQQQQQQEEYYDDLDSNHEEDEENQDEISYQQQNQFQNEEGEEYYNNNEENVDELTQGQQEEDQQYNMEQDDEYAQEWDKQANDQYQNEMYQQEQERMQGQNEEMYELNEQQYLQQQQNYNMQFQQQQQQYNNVQPNNLYHPNNQFQNSAEKFNSSNRESLQNNSLRSSKQGSQYPNKRFEENLSSVKKKQNGLYNQKINFDGDNNFKLNDQPFLVENLYQSDGFSNQRKRMYPGQQYQSLQMNNPQQNSNFQSQQFNNLNNNQMYQQSNNYFQDQYKNTLQKGNELVDEVADDQSSLSQISQSPLRPSQLQLADLEQQQNYEGEEQMNYEGDEQQMDQYMNAYQQQIEEQQILSHRSHENYNNNRINSNNFESSIPRDQVLTNNNYVFQNSYNVPQTENISVNTLLQLNKRNTGINDQFHQNELVSNNLFRVSSQQQQQNGEDKYCEVQSQIPKEMNEYENYDDQRQQQMYPQQNKLNTQQTQEESFYDGRILADINLESVRKEKLLSQDMRGDYEGNSQENLSQREGIQRQNSSRCLASAENVKKKNISRRIFNQSARYYNEYNPLDQRKKLEDFEAEQKNKKVRASLQGFVEELNEISGRSARGLLDLSHRIQQSNSFILDRSNMNEKSFYQNEKSFNQNDKSFNNNNNPNQSEIDDNSYYDNTVLTGGCNSNKKDQTIRDNEQRLSEYIINHNTQNEEIQQYEIVTNQDGAERSPIMVYNENSSTTMFENTQIQLSNNSYLPSTSVFQIGNQQQQQLQYPSEFNAQSINDEKNNNTGASNDSPFIITTQERRRSNGKVDEISIKFNEPAVFTHASFNQDQMHEVQKLYQQQQSQQTIENQEEDQVKKQSNLNSNEKEKEDTSSNRLQDSPFIDEKRKSEKLATQQDQVQLASFAHSDNFISIQQVAASVTVSQNQNANNFQSEYPNADLQDSNLNSETILISQQVIQQQQESQIKSSSPAQVDNLSNQENKSEELNSEGKEELLSSKSENSGELIQSKKIQGVQRSRPISEIPTESKFVKQRQPHFEDNGNKESHTRSQSNHLKKKKHFELSIDACNEVQKQQLSQHNHESKETPQFSEFGASTKSSGLFKPQKPHIPNKRQQIISFLDYQKSVKKNSES